MSHSDKIKDCDAFFEVNPITRQIINKTPNKIVLMQGDHNSERFTFSLPRYIEGHDMAESAKAYLHYVNPTKQDSGEPPYEMEDLRVDPDDAEKVICSWLISENVTKEPGALSFLIEFKCFEGEVLVYSWHTLPHTGITIGATFDFSGKVATKYADVLHQWEQRLFGLSDEGVQVADLDKFKIKNKANGEIITLSDSAEAPLNNIKIFGKTTQNGTPTPEAPIDLVSVGDNGSLSVICGNNILPYPYISSKECPTGYTDNGDGSITANWYNNSGLRYFQLYDGDLLSTGRVKIGLIGEHSDLFVYCKIKDEYGRDLYSENSSKSLVLDISKYPTAKKLKIGIRNSGNANFEVSGTVYPVYMDDFNECSVAIQPLKSIVGTDIKDEIDTKRKVRIQRVGRAIVTEAVSTFKYITYTGCVCKLDNYRSYGKVCSDRYSDYYEAETGTANNTIEPYNVGARLYDNRIAYGDINKANEILAKEKPEVLYELAEPIETPLTDEEIEAYKALYTYYPKTFIYNSDNADIEVEYVADTKNYIDNKFAALEAAIISTGGNV